MRVQYKNFTSVQGDLLKIFPNTQYVLVHWFGDYLPSVVYRPYLTELPCENGCFKAAVKCEKCFILAKRRARLPKLIANGRRFRYLVPASELPRVPLRASSKDGMKVSYFRG